MICVLIHGDGNQQTLMDINLKYLIKRPPFDRREVLLFFDLVVTVLV